MRIIHGLVLGLAGAGAIYVVRLAQIPEPEGFYLRDPDGYFGVADSQETEAALSPFVSAHNALIEESVVGNPQLPARLSEAEQASDGRPGAESPKWEDRFPRTHHDLVVEFLGHADSVTARRLVRRHEPGG